MENSFIYIRSKGGNKVAIQNDKLKDHLIEKPLPMLDLKKWDDCKDD